MREARLGEFLTPAPDPVSIRPDADYATAGILSHGQGLFRRPVVTGRDVSYSRYFRLRQDQFVYSRLFGWEGALAVVPSDFDGLFVSQEFPVFDIDRAQAHSEFVAVLCRWPELTKRISGTETGMGGRRKRVHPNALLDVRVPLPSLAEQRRIVDLMASVTGLTYRYRGAAEAARRTYVAILYQVAESAERRLTVADCVVTAKSGGTPSRANRAFYGGEIPWLKSGEVARAEIRSTEEAITEAGLANSSAWLAPAGAVVLAMYGATAGAVGRTKIDLATNQAVLALFARPQVMRQNMLFHMLRWLGPELKASAVGAAQPNLSKGRVLAAAIPVLALSRQTELGTVLDALLTMQELCLEIAFKTERAGQSLAGDLLSAGHEVTSSYDRFLDGAA